jgi:tetratricopeptide (TPR) repeat protein
MVAMEPESELPRSVRRDIQQIVARAQDRVSDQSISKLGQKLLRGMLVVLNRASDYDELEQQVRPLIRDLDAGRAVLRGVLDEAISAEAAWIEQERFGDVWWKRRHREVEEAFEKGSAAGRRRWLQTYTEALIASRFDVCLQMTLNDWPTPDGLETLRTGAAALNEGRYRDAVKTVEMLAREDVGPTDVPSRVKLLVFLGRIQLYELSNVIAAREWIQRALALDPDDGRPVAALGEYLRICGELDQAYEQVTRAIHLSPRLPAGYIGAAMICEDQKNWHRAQDLYNDAIDAAGETARFGQLLAPAPAGLYWQLARRQKKRQPAQALDAIERALKLGVRWSNDYPDRRALKDRAEILELLGRSRDAADSYFQAGQRYSWISRVATARPLLEKACKLDPRHAAAHWQLSEVLRVLSYRKSAPFVDSGLVELSKSHWDVGRALQHPDASMAWVYLGRALLNHQRWLLSNDTDVLWEAIVYLECALILNQDYATAWAYLAMYYRVLNNFEIALHATEQALSIDPADLAGLEQRSAVLAAIGRYHEAEEAIDQRLEQADEFWPMALKAYAQLRTGRAGEALELINRVVEAVPDEDEYRALRGQCRRRLGQHEESDADYQWIWDHRDAPHAAQRRPQTVAEAGYLLGEFDGAADILRAAIEKNPVDVHELWLGLGQVLLARGDPAREDVTEGTQALEHGMALVHNAGQLDDLLSFDLDELERILAIRPGSEPAKAALTRVRALVRQVHDTLSGSVSTVDDELRAAAEAAPTDSSMWLAAQAGLANVASAEGRWKVAHDRYLLLGSHGSFPEAEAGLARAISRLQDEADELARGGKVTAARERYETLLDSTREHLGAAADITISLALRAGFAALTQSDDEAVYRHLGLVVSNSGIQGREDEFSSVEMLFFQTSAQYWNLVDGLRRLQDRYVPDAKERAILEGLIVQLDLSRLYRLAAVEVTRFPMATPLALRISPDLKPTDFAGEVSLGKALAAIQERVKRDSGIRVPGVRMLDAEGSGNYVILIDATPVASGFVPTDQRFVLSPDAHRPLAAHQDRHPLSGDWGAWLSDREASPASLEQLSPLDFVLCQLEATLRRNLPSFIGVDDIQAWLDNSPEDVSDLAPVVLPDRSTRVLLSRVLQLLARECVPLTQPVIVLKAIHSALPSATVPQLAAAVRMQMRLMLPGNSQGTRHVKIPQPVEDALAAGLHSENGATFWQLSRPETAELLSSIRDIDQDALAGNQTALVVRDRMLRPFVWRLICAEFPHLSVLCEEELIEREAESGASASMA